MQTPEAARLSELIHQKAEDFKELCEGLDEETASRAPFGTMVTERDCVTPVRSGGGRTYADFFRICRKGYSAGLTSRPRIPFSPRTVLA